MVLAVVVLAAAAAVVVVAAVLQPHPLPETLLVVDEGALIALSALANVP
jgi:hypothetical protein